MSLSMISTVYTGNNQSGNSRLYAVSTSNRYTRADTASLMSNNLSGNISSATLYASSRSDATQIFFDNSIFGFLMPSYTGRFVQITNRRNAGSELDVNFSAHNFNNRTRSLLLVTPNTGGLEIRLSMRDLFLTQWNTILDDQLSGERASRNGNPTLTWAMWPTGIAGLDSNLQYLKIHQRLDISVPWWPDYEASITYYILLSINGAGRLQGSVAASSMWVESGAKQGRIERRLEPQVTAGIAALNTELTNQLGPYSGFTFRDVYLLPGNQTDRPPTGVITGNTTDDVTIVVVI